MEQSAKDTPVLVQEFVIANRLGIHARVAAQIVRVATQFESGNTHQQVRSDHEREKHSRSDDPHMPLWN